jgi:hypothetical protein
LPPIRAPAWLMPVFCVLLAAMKGGADYNFRIALCVAKGEVEMANRVL